MTELPGYDKALARAREIQSLDTNFLLDEKQELVQGLNNRVLSGNYDGGPAVLKYYDDCINKKGAVTRKGIESFSIQHMAEIVEVPRLYAEFNDCIIMERFVGQSFAARIQPLEYDANTRNFLYRIGTQCGHVYAQIATCDLSDEDRARFIDAFHQGEPLEQRIEDLLITARDLCFHVAEFRDHAETLNIIENSLPTIREEHQIIFRYDNNFGNMLIQNDHLIGLVDFEQCYLGTETILLGAMLDTIPEIYPLFPKRPAWAALKSAYEERRDIVIDDGWFKHIIAMAMMNHWYRIVDMQSRRGTLDGYVTRFKSRFPILSGMYSAAARIFAQPSEGDNA